MSGSQKDREYWNHDGNCRIYSGQVILQVTSFMQQVKCCPSTQPNLESADPAIKMQPAIVDSYGFSERKSAEWCYAREVRGEAYQETKHTIESVTVKGTNM